MKRKFLQFAVMATVALSATTAQAAGSAAQVQAQAQAQAEAEAVVSIIRGRVVDSEKNVLAGAVIYIEDLKVGAVSDLDGYYILTDVVPGKHTVTATYVGYEDFTTEVNSVKGKTDILDITMNAGIQIGAVEVVSVMQGQHRAINTQKNALQMVDVVSSDQAGKYPDSNIGDALKRISGINVQYDQGEARFGQVRGTPADMSSVTVNGNRVPSAEGETRSVQLDLIPTDMIQTIEVNKVVTPDMDADAIGGSINLITKNSPSKRILSATAGTGYSAISNDPQLNLGFTYGDKLSDKFGFIVAASYQNNSMGSDNTEFEWSQDDNGDAYLKEMQVRQYYVTRERQSYSAAFNYTINPNHKLDFKALYNRRNDWENRYRTKIKMNDDYTLKEVAVETKGGSDDVKYSRLERQQTLDLSLGGEHLFGKLLMDWGATYASASELRPDERYVAFTAGDDEQLNLNFSDPRQPTITNAADYLTLSSSGMDWELDELSESQQTITERDFKANLNFKYSFSQGDYASTLKFGGKVTAKKKSVDIVLTDYTDDADGTTFLVDALSTTQLQDRSGFMLGEAYNFGRTFTTREFLGDYNLSNLGNGEVVLSESAGNYEADETVSAAYVRLDQKLGAKVDMMVGLRMENTSVSYSGHQYDEDEDTLTSTGEANNSSTNFLPSVMFKWDANKDLKLRASFTNTIARPKYSDLVNKVEINDDDEVTLGNPDLKSSISYNYDISADYYFESLGLIRGGLFAKRINDFIVDETVKDEYANLGTTEISRPINAGNATLLGAEISLSRDFGFISPALSCMGFSGTYTYTHSKVTDFNVDGRENEELSLPGSPESTANASIYFQKWGLTARLSYNYASAFIDELGSSSFDDIYYDKVNYMDLNLNYTFKTNYSIYADVTNILNQPLRYYQGVADRTYQAEYYGARFNIGFKVNF